MGLFFVMNLRKKGSSFFFLSSFFLAVFVFYCFSLYVFVWNCFSAAQECLVWVFITFSTYWRVFFFFCKLLVSCSSTFFWNFISYIFWWKRRKNERSATGVEEFQGFWVLIACAAYSILYSISYKLFFSSEVAGFPVYVGGILKFYFYSGHFFFAFCYKYC